MSDLKEDALRAAVGEYTATRATLRQAAKLAGLDTDSMQRILVERGVFDTGDSVGTLPDPFGLRQRAARSPLPTRTQDSSDESRPGR